MYTAAAYTHCSVTYPVSVAGCVIVRAAVHRRAMVVLPVIVNTAAMEEVWVELAVAVGCIRDRVRPPECVCIVSSAVYSTIHTYIQCSYHHWCAE